MTNAQSKFEIQGNFYRGICLDTSEFTWTQGKIKKSDLNSFLTEYFKDPSNSNECYYHGINCCADCGLVKCN